MPTYRAVRTATRSLLKRIGRRGAWLLWLAFLDFSYAFGLINPTRFAQTSPTLMYLERWMPLNVWGYIWGIIAIICLVHAFRIKDAIGYGAAIGIKVGWATTFLLGWLAGEVERGYLTFAIFITFAAAVMLIAGWRENYEMHEIDLHPPPLTTGERP